MRKIKYPLRGLHSFRVDKEIIRARHLFLLLALLQRAYAMATHTWFNAREAGGTGAYGRRLESHSVPMTPRGSHSSRRRQRIQTTQKHQCRRNSHMFQERYNLQGPAWEILVCKWWLFFFWGSGFCSAAPSYFPATLPGLFPLPQPPK